MTDQDRASIETAPTLMLAEWWCTLNKWGWPKEGLGEEDPPTKHPFNPNSRRASIMQAIVHRIGHKECLREWNKDTMSPKEFEEWYNRYQHIALPPQR